MEAFEYKAKAENLVRLNQKQNQMKQAESLTPSVSKTGLSPMHPASDNNLKINSISSTLEAMKK
jgi:hypothetical protein